MQPTTMRKVGTVAIVSGILSLLAFVALIALVGTGTSGPPQSFMVVVVPVQSVVNIVIGWMLRRQGQEMTG